MVLGLAIHFSRTRILVQEQQGCMITIHIGMTLSAVVKVLLSCFCQVGTVLVDPRINLMFVLFTSFLFCDVWPNELPVCMADVGYCHLQLLNVTHHTNQDLS